MMLSSYCWALATPADAATNATARMLLRMGSPFISEASGHSWNPLFTKDPRGHGEEVATGGRAEKLPGGFPEPAKRPPGGRPYLGQSVTAPPPPPPPHTPPPPRPRGRRPPPP